jgi:hypothetical protein
MDWKCGSSGRAPALQMQSPELKPPVLPKKKNHKPKFGGKFLTQKAGCQIMREVHLQCFLRDGNYGTKQEDPE